MFSLFLTFAQVATWIAIITLAGICILSICFCLLKKEMPVVDEIKKHLMTCKVSSVIFVILSWLFVSGDTMANSMEEYIEISDTCLQMGRWWIIIGFANIAVSIVVSLISKDSKQVALLNKTRVSTFVTGVIFCVLAMILDIA